MIVFDMEWNSGRYERVRLNEILQISAVKVEGIRILDTFNAYIRPKAHKRFSPPAEALPALEDCLRSDLDFPGAMERFLTWCGEDHLFGTWGENDFQTLKENLLYWKVEAPLPDTFLDLQAGFCATVGAKGAMALQYAVEYCRIPDIFDFHDARNDALYTALVSQYIAPAELEGCRRVPGPPREEQALGRPSQGPALEGPLQEPGGAALQPGLPAGDVPGLRCPHPGERLGRRGEGALLRPLHLPRPRPVPAAAGHGGERHGLPLGEQQGAGVDYRQPGPAAHRPEQGGVLLPHRPPPAAGKIPPPQAEMTPPSGCPHKKAPAELSRRGPLFSEKNQMRLGSSGCTVTRRTAGEWGYWRAKALTTREQTMQLFS